MIIAKRPRRYENGDAARANHSAQPATLLVLRAQAPLLNPGAQHACGRQTKVNACGATTGGYLAWLAAPRHPTCFRRLYLSLGLFFSVAWQTARTKYSFTTCGRACFADCCLAPDQELSATNAFRPTHTTTAARAHATPNTRSTIRLCNPHCTYTPSRHHAPRAHPSFHCCTGTSRPATRGAGIHGADREEAVCGYNRTHPQQ